MDRGSHSPLSGEFEVVIMIEVVVEQMEGSDRFSEPEMDYAPALDWLRTVYLRERNGALSGVHAVVCSKSSFDTPGIVRDAIFRQPLFFTFWQNSSHLARPVHHSTLPTIRQLDSAVTETESYSR
jgi:hypothetical protein